MINLIMKSVVAKLAFAFMILTLLAIGVIGYLSFHSAKQALIRVEFEKINVLRDLQANTVRDYIKETADLLLYLAGTRGTRQGIGALVADADHKIGKELDAPATGNYDLESSRDPHREDKLAKLRYMDQIYESHMNINGAEDGYEDLMVLCAAHGHVIYSRKRLSDLGDNVKTGDLKATGLAKLFETVMSSRRPAYTSFSMYKPANAPAAFCGTPIYDPGQPDKLIGILVMRISPSRINEIMKISHQGGETVETYVVGSGSEMITDSRFSTESTIFKRRIDTEPVKLAAQGKTGHTAAISYGGAPVYSAYAPVGLTTLKNLAADADLVMIADISAAEAVQAATDLAYKIALIAVIITLVVAFIAFLLARTIARPVTVLADQVNKVGHGNLNIEVPATDRIDELGILARAIDNMVKSLRQQTSKIIDGVNILSSSAAEISATMQQVAVSTSKTSSAITETTTTVEQVKQAAKVSSQKAKDVAETAQMAVRIADDGSKATEDTVHRISVIKEQMASIGETVVRLSERSQAIEEIISTVQDLADQSNLLAVNASIEAARAGDQGKGFAVVAHEIKSLADQSKNATQQVRQILEDTRKWVTAVVMATEEGSKAVDAGVNQSVAAGESIRLLSRSVSSSAQSAAVIDSSSAQQFVGVDQVSTAMANIEQAIRQNMAGTAQLETAVQRIEDLGHSLKELVEHYKV